MLTGDEILAENLSDWRLLLRALHTRYRTGDFLTGLRMVSLIGEAAEAQRHHPDLDLRYGHLDVTLSSHDVGGVTERDVRLARTISELAAGEGVSADPSGVSVLEVALDTADHTVIKPFWRAVLGMRDQTAPDELADPDGGLPTLWFQPTDAHPTPRQRFHLDIHVPHDVALDRLAAGLAAGGRLVDDSEAPSFWVLADAEGNKACICTWQAR